MTNAWVMTADQCIPKATEPATIMVAFGSDSRDPQQTRGVYEVRRFPGNDGTAENRGRDLLLLGVDKPFVIDERTSRFQQSIQFGATATIPGLPLRCVGWDFEPDPASASDRLRTETLMSISVDTGVSTGGNPAGNRVWWQNSDPVDKTHGILPTPLDVGTSCFYSHVNTEFLLTVHSGNPELRRDGTVNDHDEAYSVGLGEPLVRNWVDNVMFGAAEEAVALSSKVATCSIEPGTVELFGIEANGKIAWWRWNEAWHHEATIEPPEGVALARDKLGVLCTRRGTIGLFARSTDGEIWQQVGEPLAGSPGEWLPVLDASTPITSGIGVVGLSLDHFHVFARGESGELRHAEYKNGWTGKWADLGGALVGTPAAAMWYEGRINLFVRWEDDSIYEGWFYDGVWRGWVAHGATVTSDPVVTSWGDDRLDVLVRSAHGTMLHLWYDAWWVDPWIDTGIPMPEGSPAMLSWERGRLDLFVGQGESSVWRAVWPRLPSPQTGMRKRAE